MNGLIYYHAGPVLIVPAEWQQPEIPGWEVQTVEPLLDGTRIFCYRAPQRLEPGTPDPRD